MKLSKKSWHYKLYKYTSFGEPIESCEYISAILLSIGIFFGLVSLVSFLLYSYLYGAYSFYMFGFDKIPIIVKNYDIYDESRLIFLIISVIILITSLLTLIAYSIVKYEDYKFSRDYYIVDGINTKKEETPPSFFAIVWNKFKNKVCHKIELTN